MEVVAATTAIDTTTIPSPGSNTTFDTNTGGAYIHRCHYMRNTRTRRQVDAIYAHALHDSVDIAPIPTPLIGSGAAYQVVAIPSVVCLALYPTPRTTDDTDHIWGKTHPRIG